MKPKPGTYVEFHRRIEAWPYREKVFGIIVGNPAYGLRVRTIDVRPETTHVIRETSARLVTFKEAHPYRCHCGRSNPGGCDVMHGGCAWNPPR